ncbi:dimethyl sulfoxide reductase anchor subunit [Adlercreutzia sp. ZJ138]|uniref:dimethyl sulfoxide reductase anchor subunit family protein n=1 Tax=Adlercreutzia sp. ZJ138 TaxID=2709405 RepID=UPI0013EC5350|nr:dimethyl sulfoxide reductase anchor subunit [Adlercreutzia sp. ZJ138]
MELQWPLIIFTTLVAWSAGLFASQCVLGLKGIASKAQMPAWIASAALLAVGGIAVFFHLEHWDRIFNGFGNLTSGIAQELIAIVALAIVAVIYLAMIRKGDGKAPAWIAIIGIAVAAILVIVMAHSYLMASRPAWNSLLWVLAVLGNACVLGPATMSAIIAAVDKETDMKLSDLMLLGGSAVNAVTTVAYIAAAAAATSAFTTIGYNFDPVHPTKPLADAAAYSPFAGDSMILTIVAIVSAIAALAVAFLAKKQGKQVIWGSVAAACAFVGALTLRMVFYNMGASVFMFF